jgi:hypothetical protein
MVFQATQNAPTELEELSVERDVEADGYVVGFEDAGGSFVEVGRLENVADNVSQPLEIKHANSGERITLDDSGLKMQKIDDDRLYAGAFPGSDPDSRLSNAISEASLADMIYLENDEYSDDLTLSEEIKLVGTGTRFKGTEVTGTTTWTFDGPVNLSSISAPSTNVVFNINGDGSTFMKSATFNGTSINVSGSGVRLSYLDAFSVTLDSNSSNCVVDSSVRTVVTDNGSSNVIGDV